MPFVQKTHLFLLHASCRDLYISTLFQQIVNFTSFDNMKERNISKGGKMASGRIADDAFFRKGIVGDWHNYLTKEMSDYIDEECKTKLEPQGLVFKYSL